MRFHDGFGRSLQSLFSGSGSRDNCWSFSMRINGRNVKADLLHFTSVSDGRELDDLMQRTLHVRQIHGVLIQEISQQTSHDCLVTDDEDVLLPLQLHDDWLETRDQVLIRFSPRISVVEFVLVSLGKVFRVLLLNLFISHLIADSGVDFIESLPGFSWRVDERRSLLSSLVMRSPNAKLGNLFLFDEGGQSFGEGPSPLGEI